MRRGRPQHLRGRAARNVPDDWDMYWRRCSFCGAKYHASEVNCECRDEEDRDESEGHEGDKTIT